MTEPRWFKLGILALEGGMLSSVASPGDALRVAQALADIREPGSVRLESLVMSARGRDRVRTASGLDLVGLQPVPAELDMLLVPGVIHRSPQELLGQLEHLAPEAALIRALHLRGAARARVADVEIAAVGRQQQPLVRALVQHRAVLRARDEHRLGLGALLDIGSHRGADRQGSEAQRGFDVQHGASPWDGPDRPVVALSVGRWRLGRQWRIGYLSGENRQQGRARLRGQERGLIGNRFESYG